jgi:hypothetical protein
MFAMRFLGRDGDFEEENIAWVYTSNCLIILLLIFKTFFFIFLFTGSNLQVPKFAWQTLWKVMFFQESQQGP